ncbi:hypothetical protein CHREV_265 [Choristoneura rosaceana entomopoxvirus 'L']|uniref:N1R/p28-like protein n=1 Tax=Choristoneura rosaceana entomopoxvirus 'L' TaxID=1293539 RepID=A0ABM9QKV2_9POXV|nr:hypothetical protein CHREV_265 [Choristoneura rosaceana entomopoxvirus 'L']CCU56167.1 hypothetical protein CHREV_265 [Choristoneura rosaceana entomopoxvirus 'L']
MNLNNIYSDEDKKYNDKNNEYEPRINYYIDISEYIDIESIEKTLRDGDNDKTNSENLYNLFYHTLKLLSYYINNCNKYDIKYFHRENKFYNYIKLLDEHKFIKSITDSEIIINTDFSDYKNKYLYKEMRNYLMDLLKINNITERFVTKLVKK